LNDSRATGHFAGLVDEAAMIVTARSPERVLRRASLLRSAALAASVSTLAASAIAQTAVNVPGRLIASNCFQCHGTNGKGPGFDRIAGKSANEIYNELKEFQSGKEGQGIMARHSMGYTDAQMRSLSQWLSTQR
jgi:cytochrome c553